MRIVSLLPSATEILFAVGAGDDVVGVTFECDFPSEAKTKRVVSTTALADGLTPAEIDAEVRRRVADGEELYSLDSDGLRALDPDVVITQDLCAVCAIDVADVDRALEYLGCSAEVVTLDPRQLTGVLESIVQVGAAVGRHAESRDLVTALRSRLNDVSRVAPERARPRVAVLEWTDPPYSAGHWVPDLVTAAGGLSVLGTPGGRSVAGSWSEVAAVAPDIVVVAPCGYHLDASVMLANELLASGLLPTGAEVWAADADAYFVRPGPRVVDGVEGLAWILQPDRPARPEVVTRVTAA